MDVIKTPKVERVLLRQFHHSREYVTGTLCLTDRHIIFIEPTGAQETWVLYHHINSVERLALTTRGYPLVIRTKTFQQLHLIIPRESDCLDIMDTIDMFAKPESYSQLFAFQYKPKWSENVKQRSGWALYDVQAEFERMGVPNPHWKCTDINKSYEVCETYSSSLYVPAGADKTTLLGSVKFRSKGRLPVLSYYYAPKKSAVCRSSQPLVGLRGRSLEDEQLIQSILDANPDSESMYVLDTRPKINAMANKAAGKGYESTGNYSNVMYQFYNIHNIHVMRESLQKMMDVACPPNQSVSGFLLGLEGSGWMKHIHLILEASIFIAKALHEEGVSVLVHCSDGWDRTAQTCALTSLLLDPYYRTLHGFMILIEKEWLSFGHKFSIRCGHLAGENRETSPIFTQFLECVWQLMVQFPTTFQFNELFLLTLHDHVFSCQFGTFLGNCEREREEHQFREHTYSLWGYVWAHLDDFINPLFCHAESSRVLEPITDIPHLSFWQGLYCRYNPRDQPSELMEEHLLSLNQQNTCLEEHIKFLQQNIQELKQTLASFQSTASASSSLHNQGSSKPTTSDQPTCSHRTNEILSSKNDSMHPVSSNSEFSGHKGVQRNSNPDTGLSEGNAVTSRALAREGTSDSGIERSSEVSPEKVACGSPNSPGGFSDGDISFSLDDEGGIIRFSLTNGRTQENDSRTSAAAKPRKEAKRLTLPQDQPIVEEEGAAEERHYQYLAKRRLSPPSFSNFREHLFHVPEMNLPWQSMRTVWKCSCGSAFSFSVRKYHCSYCGQVVCGSCSGQQAPLPSHATPRPQRVCRTCNKLMRRREMDLESQN